MYAAMMGPLRGGGVAAITGDASVDFEEGYVSGSASREGDGDGESVARTSSVVVEEVVESR